MMNLEINEEIEDARKQMIQLGCQLGLLHPRVVESSENLDKLLLSYYHQQKNRSRY
ncbi:aspartyl-phosphate phosphatase Spo0E family protein [Paenibacillus senegalensis]|uniref:aspartyl-phosphate phosphatase Spo0E family protein n=1 Tax=Paenibacillus senegalensis TaxID=1465766 RepID=UPI0002890EE5|nr:aspartyl-phosphate phosphatase Spo0E family protein [Paenibacillus senegalensis]